MTRTLSILAVICALLIQFPAIAIAGEPSEGPDKAAEKFYAEYLVLVKADKETTTWMAKSKLVTPAFKKYYAKQMSPKNESVESDPVLEAQDTPTSPFKAGKTVIKGDKATVSLSAKFDRDIDKVDVDMVLKDGVWLVDMVRVGK